MKITFTQIADLVSPDLAARLLRARNKTAIHSAIGLAVISITKRAFNDASLRPAPWPALANGQPATLRRSGTLAKSVRVLSATDASVLLGSDRKYAAIHQLGGKTQPHTIRPRNGKALAIPGVGLFGKVNHPGSRIPARPYFPFDAIGQPTPRAHTAILAAIQKKLEGQQ